VEHGQTVWREERGRKGGQVESQGFPRRTADVALNGKEHTCVVGWNVPPLEALNELVPGGWDCQKAVESFHPNNNHMIELRVGDYINVIKGTCAYLRWDNHG